MKEAKGQRSKRGSTVINLVQTASGYSIIEGTELLNKQNHQGIQHTTSTLSSSIQIGNLPPQKQHKQTIKQTNLLFLRGKFQQQTSRLSDHEPQELDRECREFAHWFTFHDLHNYQVEELKSWYLADHGRIPPTEIQELEDFQAMVEKYQQHRNKIVKLYLDECAPSGKYLSGSRIRKFIADDACWLMKIHTFLSSWGIINIKNINIQAQNLETDYVFKFNHETKKFEVLEEEKKTTRVDVNLPTALPETIEDQNQVLKTITHKIRPYCDYCGVHCGIVWYQHLKLIDPKQISTIMKNVNSKNPPLSEKEYEVVLCVNCYCDGNFPLLLTHQDFKKVSVNDKLEPGKKKKLKKKKKDKRKKTKQHLQQEEEYKEEEEKGEDHAKDEEEGSKDHQKKEKESGKKNNGIHEQKGENGVVDKVESEKKINQVIQQIISKIQKERVWTLEEIDKLLELIEEHGERWEVVHQKMVESGYCQDCSPEDLIQFFLTLPMRGASKLSEQYNNQQFLQQNKKIHKSQLYSKIIERNVNYAVQLNDKKQKILKNIDPEPNSLWKQQLEKLTSLYIQKLNTRIDALQKLQAKSKEIYRITTTV